jgi:hypothetical protein
LEAEEGEAVPAVQYYADVRGGTGRAVVFGFRTKVEF